MGQYEQNIGAIFLVILKSQLSITNISGTITLVGEIHNIYGSLWKKRRRRKRGRKRRSDASKHECQH